MATESKADRIRRDAQGHFSQPQKREQTLKAEREKAQTSQQEKIQRLRTLRLAKEADTRDKR